MDVGGTGMLQVSQLSQLYSCFVVHKLEMLLSGLRATLIWWVELSALSIKKVLPIQIRIQVYVEQPLVSLGAGDPFVT